MIGGTTTASTLLALALGLSSCLILQCSKPGPPPPFEGARPFALASAAAGSKLTSTEVERLVSAVVDVAGGAARLRKLSWRRVEDLYLQVSGDPFGTNAVVTTSVRSDQSIRTFIEYKSKQTEERVMFERDAYLAPRGSKLMRATGATQQFVEWDWELARLPVLLLEAASLEPLPIRVDNGRTLAGVKVDVAEFNPKFEAWIDLAGPMIVEVRATLPLTGDLTAFGAAAQTQTFSEFRRIDGVLLPFRRDVALGGKRFALGEARSYEVDVELPDPSFLPNGPPPPNDDVTANGGH